MGKKSMAERIMKLRHLRFIIGFLVLGSHLGYPFWLFGTRGKYLELDQIKEMTLMVMPVLAVSLVVVIRAMMRDEMPDDANKVRFEKAATSFLVVMTFVAALYGVPLLFPETIESVNALRSTLLLCDTVFGMYLGYIVDVLFVARTTRSRRDSPGQSTNNKPGKK
jgi:hypothetical protein